MIKPCIKRYGILPEPKDVSGTSKSINITSSVTLKEPFLLQQVTHWAYIEIGNIQSFVLGDNALIYDLESAGFINLTTEMERIL